MATVTGTKRKLSINVEALEANNTLTLGSNAVATQSWVTSTIIDGAPDALNTLNELAAAINDTSDYAATVTAALGNRLRIDAAQGLNATQQSQGRSNLGLGTAATSNTGDFAASTHNHDSAYWRTARSVSLTGSNPFDDAKTETRVTGTGNYVISYTGASAQLISSATGGSASIFQIGAHYNGSDFYMRTRTDSTTWQTWKKLWHTGNLNPSDYALANHSHSNYASSSHNHDSQYVRIGARLTGDASAINYTSIRLWDVSTSTDKPADAADGLLTTGVWDSSGWATQQYHDFHTNKLYLRSKQNSVWQDTWATVWTTDNFDPATKQDAGSYAAASHNHDGRYMRMDSDTHTTGGIEIRGSLSRGTYTTASQYHTGADNIVLKGNASGISGIFFESEKDGTNINHSSDFGFIQYHAYGTGTTGEANELVIGVSNDADDHLVLNAPNVNGLKFRIGASNTDYTVWHAGNFDAGGHNHDSRYYTESEVDTLLNAKANSSHTHDDRYYTESESDSRYAGRGWLNEAYVDVYVQGDANTFYPVRIAGTAAYGYQRYSVSRRYNWTAPDTWNTATHRGGLTLTMEWSGDTAWGGNHKPIRVIEFAESYSNMVGGLALPVTGGLMVWLRGGNAQYRFHCPSGVEHSVTVDLEGFTAGNGQVYSPRNADEAAAGRSDEINTRWPVRGDNDLYDSNQRVATQTWVSGQGYLTSLPSHTHSYLPLTGGTLSDDLTVNGGRIIIKRGTGLTHTEWEDDSSANGRGQLILDSHYSDLIIASRNTNVNKHGSTLTFATQSTSTNDVAKWVIGQGQYQEGADHLAFAYGTNQTNPHSILGTDNAYASFVIMNGGKVVIGGTPDKNGYNSTDSTKLMFGGADGDAQNNYYIGTNKEDYGGNYTKLDLRWHTGIRMGAQPSYGGIRFFNNEDLGSRIMSIGETDANVRIDNNLWIGGAGGWITDLLNAKQAAGSYAASDHNHTYNVNNSWLRDNGDDANVKLYGNTRQMVFRTDGTTEYASGVGGYPFAWMYGGDAASNRRMLLNSSGQLWLSNYGWLHDKFADVNHNHNGDYLGISAKAADSNLIDGIDSSRIIYGDGDKGSSSQSNMDLTSGQKSGFFFYNNPTGSPFGDWTHWMQTMGNSWTNHYGFQIAHAFHSDNAAIRRVTNGSWGEWRTLITSDNIGTQSVAHAYAATSIPWSGITSKPSSFTPSSHTHAISDVTGLQAALDGKQAAGSYASLSGSYGQNFYANAFYYDDWVRNHSNNNGMYWSATGWHLYPQDNDDFLFRSGNANGAAIRFNTNGIARSYVYNDNSNQIGFLNSSRNWIFKVTDSGVATATNDVVAFSDRRLKENIETIPNALEKVEAMRGVTFTRKDTGKDSIGLIAQEVEEVIPEVVNNEGEYKGIAYGNLVGVLIEAVKELSAEVKELKAKLGE